MNLSILNTKKVFRIKKFVRLIIYKMSFEFKYLKYKKKYLELKNLSGGSPNDDVYILIDSGPPNRWVPMPARDY